MVGWGVLLRLKLERPSGVVVLTCLAFQCCRKTNFRGEASVKVFKPSTDLIRT